MTQGLWTSSDPLLQLPGFDATEIKKVRTSEVIKQGKLTQKGMSEIELFCRMSEGQRRQLNLFGGDKAKY